MIQILLPLLIALHLAPAWAALEPDDNEPDASSEGVPEPARADPAREIRPGSGANAPPVSAAMTLVSLSTQRQALAGIQTAPLQALELEDESRAYGKVLDMQDLLSLRARYRAALSELTIAEAQLKVARSSYKRISHLHRESIIPTRDLIQAEAQLASEQARCEGFRRNLQEVREEALQSWGGELFRQAVERESPLFHSLLERSRVLLLVSLPPGHARPETYRRIKIALSGERQRAREGELVSPAPRTDETTQGETWFYAAPAAGLRSGMRVDVWLPDSGVRQSGVLIPPNAIVWHMGRPWAYVQTAESRFVRRPIGPRRDLGGSWFVQQGFEAGEALVVVGGQILLSEELRPQLHAEDGDDD
jgi:hypothetical protein